MSADLDAIAQKIVNRFESHFREWMMPGEHAEAVEITKEVLSEAIAQDRKTRESVHDSSLEDLLGRQLEASADDCLREHERADKAERAYADLKTTAYEQFQRDQQQLAQQSAALVACRDSLLLAKAELSTMMKGFFNVPETTVLIDNYVDTALTYIARANAVEPRAQTSGEAVEAFITEAITRGYLENDSAICNELRTATLERLRAPSRTEREDTAPEVGGKGGE